MKPFVLNPAMAGSRTRIFAGGFVGGRWGRIVVDRLGWRAPFSIGWPFRFIAGSALVWLFLFLPGPVQGAGTNYFCIVCGKGPLTGQIWLHPRGAICDECEHIKDRCSICGLPVRNGDGHIKTGDGRIICKFDKADVILTQEQAKDLFEQTRDEVVDLYGRAFALKYPDVTVNLFDVDYWSEKGQANGLHKYGFASTRKTSDGTCTHEVVMLSGRLREEMMGVAAHEYTHLWINENCPPGHHIDGDTVEAICELTAYKLMEQKKLPDMQKKVLENPYTNGKIRDLVEVEREGGTDYVLNWVKNSEAGTFETGANLAPWPAPAAAVAMPVLPGPRPLPQGLKFSGVMSFGREQLAVINDEEFATGDTKIIKLKDKAPRVRCVEIHADEVTVEVDGNILKLSRGNEQKLQLP
jgi:hypothetical protein